MIIKVIKEVNRMAADKKRFVLLIEEDIYEKLKKIAEEQNRATSNLAVTIIKEYIKNHS